MFTMDREVKEGASRLAALNVEAAVELQVEMSSRRPEFRAGVIADWLHTKSRPPFVSAETFTGAQPCSWFHIVHGCFHIPKAALLSRCASDHMARAA